MNFSQLQERVRLELRRRVERGTMSVSLLARKTGLGQPHISNYLHGQRGLSLQSLDKVLEALGSEIGDLMPVTRQSLMLKSQFVEAGYVPLVAHQVAFNDPYIHSSNVQQMVPFATTELAALRVRCPKARLVWERFVAVRIVATDATPMSPVVGAGALVIVDRHYNSFHPYVAGRANLYAARSGDLLVVRYAEFQAGRVVLKAYRPEYSTEVIAVGSAEAPGDLLAGRVVWILNEW